MLILVFVINIFVLIYLFVNRGFVTDFSEPQSLFSLAMNSPPSTLLKGSCGGGPIYEQYNVRWGIEMEYEHLYIAEREKNITSRSNGLFSNKNILISGLFGSQERNQMIPQLEDIELSDASGYEAPPKKDGKYQRLVRGRW